MQSYDRRRVVGHIEDWTETSDRYSIEDVRSSTVKILSELRKYAAACKALAEIHKSLAGPLATKKIEVYAQRLEQRAADILKYAGLLKESSDLCTRLDHEFEAFLSKWAEEHTEEDEDGNVSLSSLPPEQSVEKLPSFVHVASLAKEAARIQEKVYDEEEESDFIDWVLDAYLTSEAGILSRMEKLRPEDFEEVISEGIGLIYGYLSDITDPDTVETVLDTMRS